MTQEVFERAVGQNMNLLPNLNKQTECACFITRDIGQFNTCGHLCRYCYANADTATVCQNMRLYDPTSPLVIEKSGRDKIHDAKQVSWIDPQMRLVF